MKKYLLLAALAVISTGAVAEQDGKKKGGFGDHLTEEQKKCIEEFNCPRPERNKGEKPSKEEMESGRECRKNAFESCGIQMPERPEGEKKEGWLKKRKNK